MSLEVIDRHSEALFEFLWCPVCGHEIFSHIPFEGMFCKNCNTQVKLRESRETRGYEGGRPRLLRHRFDVEPPRRRKTVVIFRMGRRG